MLDIGRAVSDAIDTVVRRVTEYDIELKEGFRELRFAGISGQNR